MSAAVAEPVADPGVDPRIAARRDAVVAHGRRRRWRRLALVLGVLALVAAGWYATRTPLLDVDSIEVRGADRTGADQVVLASGLRPGAPLAGLDQASATRAVEALPWVESVDVERRWGGEVVMTVVERTPVATVATETGAQALVDTTGRVLAVVPAEEPLPVEAPLLPIVGVVAPEPGATLGPDAAGALEVATIASPGLRARLANIAVWPGGQLSLTLLPQGGADLGPPTELPAKLASLVTVLSQVDPTGLLTVGLRVPDLPTVTRQ
jgi:cell division protein FtsQ